METRIASCIQEYIDEFYQGGLIGISDIANYCNTKEGEVYVSLVQLQSSGELQVIKRYFCPEFHQVDISDRESYCESCDLKYSNNQIEIAIYVQPKISLLKDWQ
jgi:hypothetical protein